MPKTSREVVTEALRNIGVVAVFEDPAAEDYDRAQTHLDTVIAHLEEIEDLEIGWTKETVPDRLFTAVANMVSGSVCMAYNLGQYEYLWEKGRRLIRKAEVVAEPELSVDVEYY